MPTTTTGTGRTGTPVRIITRTDTPARLPGEGHPHPAHRLSARVPGEYLFAGLVGLRAPAAGPPDTRPADLRLSPGDVCFYDVRHAPALHFPERFLATTFLVPAGLLGLAPPDVRRLAGLPVERSSRLGALLSPLLGDVARTAAEARPAVGEVLSWTAVDLLAALAAEQLGAPGPGPQRGQPPVLERILEYVELHLADPDLSPETIARAHHVSVRYLHKLFQDEGTTVGRWILRRRLDECRRDLLDHGRGGRTIAAVAARRGFLSATHFSRVFRAAYGMSPREWRDTAGDGRAAHGRA